MTIKIKHYVLTLGLIFSVTSPAMAAIKYVQFLEGKFAEVPQAGVQGTCKKNFVYRDANKGETEGYLTQEIVKASLTGNTVDDFDLLKDKMKGAPGICSWVTEEEFPKL